MDEETLVASIQNYKEQLSQVKAALSGGTEGMEELVQLKHDLEELITLSEESLLSIKKSKLLGMLESSDTAGAAGSSSDPPATENTQDSTCMDDEFAAFQKAISGEAGPSGSGESPSQAAALCGDDSSSSDDDEDNPDTDITGMKCCAPFTTDWGVLQYHNAIILGAEPSSQEVDTPRVRVIFCNPITNSMLPCSYFLEGKCRFSEEDCRFSHGNLVPVSDLRQYKELDFSVLEEGSQCLAKYRNGLWYPATVQGFQEDGYKVQYSSYQETAVLGAESIYPMGVSSPSSSSDSESEENGDSSNSARLQPDVDEEEEDVARYMWTPSGATRALGEWEAHTRGVGSRLMAKMGYQIGKGLGKREQGRVEPVPIVILPPGKSLDAWVEIKEKQREGKLPTDSIEKRSKKKKKLKLHSVRREPKQEFFDFLNMKLKKDHRAADSKHGTKAGDRQRSGKELNVKMLQVHEEINSLQKTLVKLKEQHLRNVGRDATAAAQFQAKISATEHQLERLRAREKELQQEQGARKSHKKLSVF
ncbi:PREDICTED: zinc finger CCCH-type with G patch domain-containing protein-like [Branchiostoma belcheri]|uniref:Zinc finger CCCH-type with G patch domain-containing protein n=1 Tax=Branchiostoma belcheri TaxID=7741 RepID=A0A6P5AMR1_BRABE|nr:PREDICTED: zinc finger CCCH-type with G patch domain-containing protein-like [Branchiostoma belcheri]